MPDEIHDEFEHIEASAKLSDFGYLAESWHVYVGDVGVDSAVVEDAMSKLP